MFVKLFFKTYWNLNWESIKFDTQP